MASDKTLVCRDCRQQFVFTAGEQEFFEQRGFGEPVRCPTCRKAHKAKKQVDAPGGGSSSWEPRPFTPRDRFDREGGGRPGGGEPRSDRGDGGYRSDRGPGGAGGPFRRNDSPRPGRGDDWNPPSSRPVPPVEPEPVKAPDWDATLDAELEDDWGGNRDAKRRSRDDRRGEKYRGGRDWGA